MNKPYFLYIINSSGICLFSYNFKRKFEIFEVPLFSGFITAVSKFSEELNRQLNIAENHTEIPSIPISKTFGQISYTDTSDRIPSIPINKTFEIMISYKENLIAALIVEKKDIDKDMKNFLEDLINEFLGKFKDILADWNDDVVIFESFANDIERIFEKMAILSFQIPKLKNENYRIVKIDGYDDILQIINHKKDIKEISELLGKKIDVIKNMVSKLLWHEVITLSEKVYEEDIFEPKRDMFYLIRTKTSIIENNKSENDKEKEFELLKAIDGFKTVYDLSEEFKDSTLHDIKHIISFYLTQGNYLEKVELYPQIIRIDDEVRSQLPAESIALSYSLENMCDGEFSLTEISKKTDYPVKDIKKVLDQLENHVTYRKKYIK